MSKEAMKLALEALEPLVRRAAPYGELDWLNGCKAITALREALAEQPAQPMHPEIKKMYEDYFDKCFRESSIAERTWVGLTDKEAMQVCVDCGCLSEDWLTLLDAIEAKLKEKNT